MLGRLVRDGLLLPNGAGRGTVCFLPWQRRSAATVFDITDEAGAPPELGSIPPELAGQPPELAALSPEPVSTAATVVQPLLDWTAIPPAIQAWLIELGQPVAGSGRVAPPTLRATILALCTGRHLGLRVLAHVLERDPDDLRKRTLTPMVREGVLRTAYTNLRDPRQAYTAASRPPEEQNTA
jgi:ATP-dependent DNA helicase RecG